MAQLIQRKIEETFYTNPFAVSVQKITTQGISCSEQTVTFTYDTLIQVTVPKSYAFEDTVEEDEDMIELRVLPEKEAERLILDYVRSHPGAWTSDIWYDLALDPDLVHSVLKKLSSERKLEPRAIKNE
jgi:hypothetical protein